MKYIIDNLKNYTKSNGWICGHFLDESAIQKNNDLEVNVSTFMPGHTAEEHFHPKSKMVIIVTEGKVKMGIGDEERVLVKNDFVFFEEGVHESVLEVFEPTTVICIRTPSVPDNKVTVDKK